jgi:hypothetical protein
MPSNPDEFDAEEWLKQLDGAVAGAKTDAAPRGNGAGVDSWGEPDMGVLRLRRRPPPSAAARGLRRGLGQVAY